MGLKGISRLPRDTVQARRNAMKIANLDSLLGDGLVVTPAGLIAIDLAAVPGLEFSGSDLIAKVAAPIALDATGIHLDYNTDYFVLSGINLSIVNPITADIVSSNDITAANFTTVGLGTFGNLDVDTLNLNGNVITDSTGTISFVDDNLVTTGYGDFSALYLDGIREMFTPGTNNLCIGEATGSSLTTGIDNVFLGLYSGNETTEASYNLFLGASSGRSHLTGEHNVVIGYQAFKTGTIGDKNMIFGTTAGYALTGNENVFIGQEAGYTETTGSYNVLIGRRAGYRMKEDCDYNTFIGYNAGYSGAASSNANQNTMIGAVAGNSLTTGDYNVGIGVESLYDLTTGLRNAALGTWAGHGQSTGDYNVYLGALTGYVNHTYNNSIALGYYAKFAADNQFVVGSVEAPITAIYAGEGVTSATPQDITINATGGSGTDIAAGDLIIAGGKSTGDADPGDIIFKTTDAGAAGVVLQTLAARMTVSDTAVTMHKGLVIPSGTVPAPAVEGALFLDTDAGANGTLVCYSNGAWRTVTAF